MCKVIWIFNKRFLVINITHRWGKNVPFWTQYTSELMNPNLCFYLNNPWEKTMKSIFKWLNHPFGFSIYSFVLLISKFYAWTCCSCGSIFLYFFFMPVFFFTSSNYDSHRYLLQAGIMHYLLLTCSKICI